MTFKSVKDHGDQKRWHRNWLWGVFLWGSVLMTGANTDENCSFAWPATLWRGLLLGLFIGLLSLVFQLQCHKDPLRPLLCSSVTGTQHVLKKCLLSKWTISYQTEGLRRPTASLLHPVLWGCRSFGSWEWANRHKPEHLPDWEILLEAVILIFGSMLESAWSFPNSCWQGAPT